MWKVTTTMRFIGRIGHLFSNRNVLTGGAMSLLSTAIVVAAVQSEGSTATNVRLDDGAVWVTNQRDGLVGRLNVRIAELDFAVVSSQQADVIQETVPSLQGTAERTVIYSGRDGGVKRLDVVTAQATGDNEVPLDDYRIGGGVAAVLDRPTGKLWVGSSQQIVAPKHPDEPDALVAAGSWLVVTQAPSLSDADTAVTPRQFGHVIVIDDSGWYRIELGDDLKPLREDADAETDTASAATSAPPPTTAAADGEIVPPDPEPIKTPVITPLGVAAADIAEVSAVGTEPVILLTDGTVVLADGTAAPVPGGQHRLQQPSGSADTVLVASDSGLYEVRDDGTVAVMVEAAASPAAPVRVGPCAFGAWSGDVPSYFSSCADSNAGLSDVPGAEANAELVWRVNQRNVALNSVVDGGVWADREGTLAYVGNWSDVEPRTEDSEEVEETPGESRVVVERTCVDGGAESPFGGDDQLGVRPRQTIIDLLNNDDDPNCEPIAITNVQPGSGAWGQLTIINRGQHVLYSPSDQMRADAAEQIQTFQFQYTVSDIGGNTDQATATVSVKDLSLGNTPPELRPKKDGSTREMRTVVEAGRAVAYNVLADWWDPDGDDLRLDGAIPEGDGQVAGTPDGNVRFDASGVDPGVHHVTITMSDGQATATERLEVTVKPVGSAIPPVTTDDFATVVKGSTVTVAPLGNDSDPNETELDLRPLWNTEEPADGYTVELQGDVLRITGAKAGVYALEYEATDGTDATPGTIRLEVVEPGPVNTGPIAVPDQVKLRPDRVVNVDVLANDVDADGDLLAVEDVQVASSDPELGVVRATLVDRRMVQVEVVRGPDGAEPTGPFVVTYRVTDAREQERAQAGQTQDEAIGATLRATGAVTVLVQPAAADQPPVLLKDTAVVRSGDIVAVPVLRNDSDPDSDELKLVSIDAGAAAEIEAAGQGVTWAQGREVYFQGGAPGRYELSYTAEGGGRRATSTVTFVVRPAPDADTNPNQPPVPPELTLRAIRNGTVRVKVPTYGIDPDGDSVVLLDELGPPGDPSNQAVVDDENPDQILFTAGRTSGASDRFTYTVRDRYGERATGTVVVMIIDDGGWAPQAHDDVFRGRPGRTLSIPVVANDTSPQDRRLEIAELPFFDADAQPNATPQHPDLVRLLDQTNPDTRGRIDVEVPVGEATLVEHYRITDGVNPADAFIRITPDPEAPNLPPVATPDDVTVEETRGQVEVTVDVLANDFDPDDATRQPVLTPAAGQNATVSGDQLTVPLQETAQTVIYRIEDAEGASAVGIVRVPGLENTPPQLSAVGKDATARTIDAATGEPLTILLDVVTEDPDGDPLVQLTDTEVQLSGVGDVRRLDDGSGFVYTPPAELTSTETVSITFEVTDRPDKSKADRQVVTCNCLATLTLGVVVQASSPPYAVAQGAVQVPQLDEPVEYDIAGLTTDDQGDPLTYTLDSSTFGGLEIEQSDSRLTIVSRREGDAKLAVGSTIRVTYTVSDGVFDPVSNSFTITIIGTNKGQPAVAQFDPVEAERDVSIRLPNFLAAASNPFASDGRPLEVVSTSVSGGASLTCDTSGNCEFLSTTVGDFTMSYTIADAIDQTVNGTIAIVVKGKPVQPAPPRIESVGDEVVNLSWVEPDDQGSPISGYRVTVVETGESRPFTSPGGPFDGLPNAQTYHFIVEAENELGFSPPSLESTGAIPDRVPSRPDPEFLQLPDYQDSQLTLAWSAPADSDEYSAITAYQIRIGGQVLDVDGGTTSIVVGGNGGMGSDLINGTDYSFEVRARNSATTNGGWGEWSSPSPTTERPSRYPDPPTNVVATNSGDGGTPRITVRWDAPSEDGGRSLNGYEVCRLPDGTCQPVGASTTQATFDQARNQTVSFTVVAFNTDKNRNNSDTSAPSASVTAVGNPDTPVISGVTSGDHQLVASASTTNGSGCSSVSVEYSRDGGATWQATGTFSGLNNGTQYTIVARAILAPTCGTAGVTYESGLSAGFVQTPYGTLRGPTMTVTGGATSGSTVRWDWNIFAAENNDTGRPWSASTSGACAGTAASAQTYSASYNGPSSQTCTVTVTSGASVVGQASRTVNVPAPPPPTATVVVPPPDRTCPETNFTGASNWNGGACGGEGAGFIAVGTQMVVSCQLNQTYGGWNPWLRIQSGGPGSGWYVAAGTVNNVSGSWSSLPSC